MAAIGYASAEVVTSWNGESGEVVADADDVGAEEAGEAAAAIEAHTDAVDPHEDRAYADAEIDALAAAVLVSLNGKAAVTHAGAHATAGADPLTGLSISQMTGLQAALDALAPKTRLFNTTAPLTGGGDLSGDRTFGISVGTSASVVAEGRAPRFFNAPVPISGRYSYTGTGATATVTPTLNQTRYSPLPVWDGFTVTSISIEVTTLQASSVIRLGLWADTGGNLPGALLTDLGTVSGAAAQAVTITPPGGLVLAPRTMYWLSATVQVAGGTVALRAANYHDPLVLPNSLNVLATVVSGYGQSGVTGALSGPAVPGDGVLTPRYMLLIA